LRHGQSIFERRRKADETKTADAAFPSRAQQSTADKARSISGAPIGFVFSCSTATLIAVGASPRTARRQSGSSGSLDPSNARRILSISFRENVSGFFDRHQLVGESGDEEVKSMTFGARAGEAGMSKHSRYNRFDQFFSEIGRKRLRPFQFKD
jgi:hypothetical protein